MFSKAVKERFAYQMYALSLFMHDACHVISIFCRYSKVFAGAFCYRQLGAAMALEPYNPPRQTTSEKMKKAEKKRCSDMRREPLPSEERVIGGMIGGERIAGNSF